jgi:hypothetical protein
LGRFCLRYENIDVNVGDGEFVAGRVAECDLVIDDSSVSRRHASFRVVDGEVEVRDLDSRNGVLVNGIRIDKVARLCDGDRICIGSRELILKNTERGKSMAHTMELVQCAKCNALFPKTERICPSCGAVDDPAAQRSLAIDASMPIIDDGAPKTQGPFPMLAQLADKAMALGRFDEAERIVLGMLSGILARAQSQERPEREVLSSAVRYALRLAESTQKASWLDYPFELYAAAAQLMPADLIDELYRVASKVRYTNPRAIRSYVTRIRSDGASLGANERFLLHRLEGLERRVVNG